MKFLQYQINRNSLFTNYRVNKFKSHKSPNCTLCQNEEVTLSFPLFDTTDHLWSMTCEVHIYIRASLPSVLSLYFCFKTLDGCKRLAQYAWYWHTLGYKSRKSKNLPHQGCVQIIVQPAQVQDQTINKRESEHIKDAQNMHYIVKWSQHKLRTKLETKSSQNA